MTDTTRPMGPVWGEEAERDELLPSDRVVVDYRVTHRVSELEEHGVWLRSGTYVAVRTECDNAQLQKVEPGAVYYVVDGMGSRGTFITPLYVDTGLSEPELLWIHLRMDGAVEPAFNVLVIPKLVKVLGPEWTAHGTMFGQEPVLRRPADYWPHVDTRQDVAAAAQVIRPRPDAGAAEPVYLEPLDILPGPAETSDLDDDGDPEDDAWLGRD